MGPFHTVKLNGTLNEIRFKKDKMMGFLSYAEPWYKTRSRKGTMRKMEVQREGKRNKRADCDVCVLIAKWESVRKKGTNKERRGWRRQWWGK